MIDGEVDTASFLNLHKGLAICRFTNKIHLSEDSNGRERAVFDFHPPFIIFKSSEEGGQSLRSLRGSRLRRCFHRYCLVRCRRGSRRARCRLSALPS